MHRILCSTGTMIGRPNGRDWRLLSPIGEKLRCDGFEFMLYDTWYDHADEILRFMQGLHVPVPAFHCEKRIGEMISQQDHPDEAFRLFGVNCAMAGQLGAKLMVMHLWDGVTSDRYIQRNLAAYPRLKETAREHGILLTVENVVCNTGDPLTHFRQLLSVDPDARFTLDTKMAAFHHQLACMYAAENADLWDHIAHLHINDYGGGYMDWTNLRTLHLGKGNVDFSQLFAFLRKISYHGDYTVEATSFLPDGVIHWDELNGSLDALRKWTGGN